MAGEEKQDVTGFECDCNGYIDGVFLDGDYYNLEINEIDLEVDQVK